MRSPAALSTLAGPTVRSSATDTSEVAGAADRMPRTGSRRAAIPTAMPTPAAKRVEDRERGPGIDTVRVLLVARGGLLEGPEVAGRSMRRPATRVFSSGRYPTSAKKW